MPYNFLLLLLVLEFFEIISFSEYVTNFVNHTKLQNMWKSLFSKKNFKNGHMLTTGLNY